MKNEYPSYLESYGKMFSYFQSNFEELTSMDRGKNFLNLSLRILPLSDFGSNFEDPISSEKHSYDKGVDAISKSIDKGKTLYIQSKYSIRGVDDLDLIISKFKNYGDYIDNANSMSLFSEQNVIQNSEYLIITLSDIDNIINQYKKSTRPSKDFFDTLASQNKFHYIHGPSILNLLQQAYRKLHVLPTNFILNSPKIFINQENVYIGILSSKELISIYDQFGDSLFLENIREYLGELSGKVEKDRATVNKAIINTLKEEPEKFLSRNNGITFRARNVTQVDEYNIKLEDASIVNGCQTTMSIVKNKAEECYVMAKIVSEENSWDVAKSANYQNEISQIDLELAQFIRPQIVRKIATQLGLKFGADTSTPYSLIEEIYSEQVNYSSIRSLFMGFFSKSPSNTIENNYTEIDTIFLQEFDSDSEKERIFESLFRIAQEMESSSEKIISKLNTSPQLKDLFQRFWKDKNSNYRAFITILTCCGLIDNDIFQKGNKRSYNNFKEFLFSVENIIRSKPEDFKSMFFNSFKIIALEILSSEQDKDKILQVMYRTLKAANFDTLLNRLQIQNLNLDN